MSSSTCTGWRSTFPLARRQIYSLWRIKHRVLRLEDSRHSPMCNHTKKVWILSLPESFPINFQNTAFQAYPSRQIWKKFTWKSNLLKKKNMPSHSNTESFPIMPEHPTHKHTQQALLSNSLPPSFYSTDSQLSVLGTEPRTPVCKISFVPLRYLSSWTFQKIFTIIPGKK
jgi:hypothetical protein